MLFLSKITGCNFYIFAADHAAFYHIQLSLKEKIAIQYIKS